MLFMTTNAGCTARSGAGLIIESLKRVWWGRYHLHAAPRRRRPFQTLPATALLSGAEGGGGDRGGVGRGGGRGVLAEGALHVEASVLDEALGDAGEEAHVWVLPLSEAAHLCQASGRRVEGEWQMSGR